MSVEGKVKKTTELGWVQCSKYLRTHYRRDTVTTTLNTKSTVTHQTHKITPSLETTKIPSKPQQQNISGAVTSSPIQSTTVYWGQNCRPMEVGLAWHSHSLRNTLGSVMTTGELWVRLRLTSGTSAMGRWVNETVDVLKEQILTTSLSSQHLHQRTWSKSFSRRLFSLSPPPILGSLPFWVAIPLWLRSRQMATGQLLRWPANGSTVGQRQTWQEEGRLWD